VGTLFILTPLPPLRGGRVVRTVDIARGAGAVTVVEINQSPWFVNTASLKPAG
jgi:hypothetical protein